MTRTDPTTIEVDQFYPHAPAKVWRALTEPELIAQWMMPGDFRLEVGHRYTMQGRAMPATGFPGWSRPRCWTSTWRSCCCGGWRTGVASALAKLLDSL